jgi:lipopolysaccharide biosynthesis protein
MGFSLSLIKKNTVKLITFLWWHAPLKRENRQAIKSFFFKNFPIIFKNTNLYQSWIESQKLSHIITSDSDTCYPSHWPQLNRQVSQESAKQKLEKRSKPIEKLAIIIHAYYGDILHEILDYLGRTDTAECKLFITYPSDKEKEIQLVLNNCTFDYEFLLVENRGRDILPFIKTAEKAISQGFDLILKVHTKKSDHRMTANLWRKEIYTALLPEKQRVKVIDLFNNNQDVGILGPAGHIVPMHLYYGINAKAIGYLCRQMGIDTRVINGLSFVAGSMFYIRKEALEPLLNLKMPDEVFEPEAGQTDGTMAHAFERAFSISAYAAGMGIVDSKFDPNNPNTKLTTEHKFTW